MKTNFKKINVPENWVGKYFLVKCPDYCYSGLQVAEFDGINTWHNDFGDNISNYVVSWQEIEEIEDNKEEEIETIDTSEELVSEQKELFKDVEYRMREEGVGYCFEHYSDWKEIEDKKFHELRLKFLESLKNIKEYVNFRIKQYSDSDFDGIE
jgi:hypothetical protein